MSQIIQTEDGSNTIVHPLLGELYHSNRGAVGESQHVFIDNGLRFVVDNGKSEITIFEVGFGSGLNCWLTLNAARNLSLQVKYIAIELYPVDMQTVAGLKYTKEQEFVSLHTSKWDCEVEITPYFKLRKHHASLNDFDFDQIHGVDLVYFDAFSPDVQPDLWRADIFRRVFKSLNHGGVVVTYTSKGEVKRAMRGVGFEVARLKGALGKHHMVRGIKPNDTCF